MCECDPKCNPITCPCRCHDPLREELLGDALTAACVMAHRDMLTNGFYDGQTWPDGRAKRHILEAPAEVGLKLALVHSELSEALEAVRLFGVQRRCRDCNGTGKWLDGDETPETCRDCNGAGFSAWWTTPDGKPDGYLVEIADAMLRIFDHLGSLGLGLELPRALLAKARYNRTRSHRHGGKKA